MKNLKNYDILKFVRHYLTNLKGVKNMNEYLKRYIALKKQFVATNGNLDSVRALYVFKEKLEHTEDNQAKKVLVDVYDLLNFKKNAYELLCKIGNHYDKKH